jgi:hypothetical protein
MWRNVGQPDRPQFNMGMDLTFWITKAKDIHSEYQYILLLHSNNGYANASQSYFISTLPVLPHKLIYPLTLATCLADCYLPGLTTLATHQLTILVKKLHRNH